MLIYPYISVFFLARAILSILNSQIAIQESVVQSRFPFIIRALKNSKYLSSKKILCIVVLNRYTVYSTILNSLLTHRLQAKIQYSPYKSEFPIVDSLSNQRVIRSNERIENIWCAYKLHPSIRSTYTQNPINIPVREFRSDNFASTSVDHQWI